jgi:hypothetical protein
VPLKCTTVILDKFALCGAEAFLLGVGAKNVFDGSSDGRLWVASQRNLYSSEVCYG